MSTLGELIAQLTALIDEQRRSEIDLRGAQAQAQSALDQIRSATDGSSSPLVTDAFAQIDAALTKLDEAMDHFAAGSMKLSEYIGVLLGHRASTTSSGENALSRHSHPPESSSSASPVHPQPDNDAGRTASPGPGPAGRGRLSMPNNRHDLNRIGMASRVRNENTVILPHVNVQADFDAIGRGEAHWDASAAQYHVNGRTYQVKPNGTAFPVRGDGFVSMSRMEYRALQAVIAAEGVREQIPARFAMDPHITPADWDKAFKVFEQRKARGD